MNFICLYPETWDWFRWINLIASPISYHLTYVCTPVHDGIVFAQPTTSKDEIWILKWNDICINPFGGDISEFDIQDGNSVNHPACHLSSSCNLDTAWWDDNDLGFDSMRRGLIDKLCSGSTVNDQFGICSIDVDVVARECR